MASGRTTANSSLRGNGGYIFLRGEYKEAERALLKAIKEAYDNNPKLSNLLLDDFFRGEIKKSQKGWRNVVATAAKKGIPVPAFSTALAFYDGYRNANLPANLLQAQRDYFGAHTYERVDKPRGEFFHTNWTGRGGTTASSTYSV